MLKYLKSGQFNPRDFNNLFVGAFLMTGMAILFITVVLVLQRKDYFKEQYHLYAHFEKGQGLNTGTQVQINGVPVGSVDSVGLRSDGSVRMRITLFTKFRGHITTESNIFAIRPKSLISERALNITHGEGGRVLDMGEVIQSEEAQDIETLLVHVNELIDHIRKISISADTLLTLAMDPESTIGAMVNSRELYDKFNTQLELMGGLSKEADQFISTLSQRTPGILNKVDSIASNTQNLTKGAENVLGGLNNIMVKADTMMTDIGGLVEVMQKLMVDSEDKLERVDDLVQGISSYWFVRTRLPQRDRIELKTEEEW